MSLVGKPPSTLDITLENLFWPTVGVRAWLEGHRIPAEYQNELIIQVLTEAIIETNRALSSARAAVQALGYASLAEYIEDHGEPVGPEDDPQDALTVLYLAAVYHLAKAKALRRFATINRRPVGENEAKSGQDTEFWYQDEHETAVAELLQRLVGDGSHKTDYGVHVRLMGGTT